MKKILLDLPADEEYSDASMPIVFRNSGVFCTKCRKRMVAHRVGKEQYLPFDETITMLKNDFEYYTCDCDDSPKVLFSESGYNTYKERADREMRTFLENLNPVFTDFCSKFFKTRRAISYTPEKQTLTLLFGGYEWLHPKSTEAAIKKPWLARLSINLNSGAAFCYAHGFISSELNKKTRLDWGGYPDVLPLYHEEELVTEFVKHALRLSGLPVELSVAKLTEEERKKNPSDYKFTLKCGTEERQYTSMYELLGITCRLIKAPNLYIRYDSYSKEVGFRPNATLAIFDIDENALSENVFPFVPTSVMFRKLQSRTLMDEGEYIQSMCENLPIPASRAFKKQYRFNPMLMGYAAFLYEAGIRKPDNITHMMYILNASSATSFAELPDIKRFIKLLVKEFGETLAVNKISASKYGSSQFSPINHLTDCGKMLKQLKEAGREVSLNGPVFEIHDRMSEEINKMRKENKIIPYVSREERRCRVYGNYEIRLAEDTHRLIDIGIDMHICVGSYDRDALEKACTIYYMVDKTGKYAACIEMRGNRLIQAKGYCNQPLEGDPARVVMQWVSDYKINANCRDYEMLSLNVA